MGIKTIKYCPTRSHANVGLGFPWDAEVLAAIQAMQSAKNSGNVCNRLGHGKWTRTILDIMQNVKLATSSSKPHLFSDIFTVCLDLC